MSNLLEWKKKLQLVYTRYSTYIDIGIRFVLALTSFLLINHNVGFMQKIANPVISVGLAVVCAVLPLIVTVLTAAGLTLAHMFTLSMGIAAITTGILLIMFIFYFRFTPKKAIILLLTPIAFALKIPVLIPIAFGLTGTPIYMVPVACGTIMYFLINFTKKFATTINSAEKAGLMDVIMRFAKQIVQSKELIVVIAAMMICLMFVYIVRRLSIDHSWEIAIASGAALYIIIMVIGNLVLDVKVKYVSLILGSIVSVILGFVLELMVFSVDYARTEHLQFEDDEYYYYVKAVPKVSVEMPEKRVKRINRRQETGKIDARAVNRQRTQLTGDADIDKLIEQELLR